MNLPAATRLLRRDPLHACVAVLGLAVGLGFCLLLLGYSRYSWSYDRQVPNVDRVFVMKHQRNWELGKPWVDQTPLAAREPAQQIPGVADVTGYVNWFPLNVERDGRLQPLRGLAVLPGFTRLMGIRALQGDLDRALASPDGIAITESAAQRLFGTTAVLGEVVTLRLDAADTNVAQTRIDAILPSPPPNTTIPYEALHGLKLSLLPEWAEDEALTGRRGFSGGYLLLGLAPGASREEVTAHLQKLVDESPLAALVPEPVKAHAGADKFAEVALVPLREAYLDQDIARNVFSTDVPRGDRRVVAGVAVVGVLLLVLAAVNFVNLALMRILRRQREIMLRKVLGVSQRRLAAQLVGESLLMSGIATVLGVVFAVLALPVFGAMLDRDLGSVLDVPHVLLALALGLVVGLLVAIYPAWVAWRVRPAHLLAGRGDAEPRPARNLRRALSVAQLALAMGLAAVTLAVALQTRHAMQSPIGFDPDPLLVARLPVGMSAKWTDQARSLREALVQHPAIVSVAVSNDTLGEARETWSTDFRRENGEMLHMEARAVSGDFFTTHGIAPLAGRLFSADDPDDESTSPLVLNAEAVRALGFASPELAVGQRMQVRGMQMKMEDHTIVGIAPNIRMRSLREPTQPVVYILTSVGSVLFIRARDSVTAAEKAAREIWPRFLANSIPDIRPARDLFAASYADDARLARLLALCTLVAMLIAACGAYVLAADAVRRRRREIALRKLFGARHRHIGGVVARELGTLLLLAAAIGLPLGGLGIARHLAPFVERTPWGYAAPAIALVVAAIVVGAAAARETRHAMRARPAHALRGD